jgi:hypothetical protein
MIKKIICSLFFVASSFGMMHEKITYSYEYSNLQSQSHESKNKPEESAQEYIPRNSLVNRRTKIVDILLKFNLMTMIVFVDFYVQFLNNNFDVVREIPKILILSDDLSQKDCLLSNLSKHESNMLCYAYKFIVAMNSKLHLYFSNLVTKCMLVPWMFYAYTTKDATVMNEKRSQSYAHIPNILIKWTLIPWALYAYVNNDSMSFFMISFKISSLHLSDWGRVFKYYITFPSFMIIVVSNVCWFVFNNMSHWARSSKIFNKL